MPANRVDDDGELQVVKAAELFEIFFRREFPKMVAVAYAVSGSCVSRCTVTVYPSARDHCAGPTS
ncbi:MAG: hypothetical protein BMS9Abin07_0432 [Acidimicrobiia bacterium]|nr:MAG: hypothetical protein BMS9Abin07_0432 [Acidimicrobiia bacterium]